MRHPQSNGLPTASPACAAFTDLLPLVAHGLLAHDDAERLNAHVATCPHCQAQLAVYDALDALLQEQSHAFARFAPTLEEAMNHIEDQQNPLPPPSPSPTPIRAAVRHNRPVTAVAILAAILVVALLAQALLSHLPQHTRVGISVHHDATATANYDADISQNWINTNVLPPVSQYPTPQQAYSIIGPARMCIHSTTIDQTETWLATSSILGILQVQAHCTDGRAPVAWAILARAPHSPGGCKAWSNIITSYEVSRPLPGEAIPSNFLATIPSWLNLPAGQYASDGIAQDGSYDPSIRYGATVWLSATHIFVVTRFKGEAVLPSNLVSIAIDERAGWYVTQDGMTTITVPLNGQEAYTFAGTGDIGTILPLATAALTHLDSLQPQMYDTGHSDVLACH